MSVKKKFLCAPALLFLSCSPAFATTTLFTETFDSGALGTGWDTLDYDASCYTPNTAETTFVASPTQAGAKALHYATKNGSNELSPVTARMGHTYLCGTVFGGTCPTEINISWYEDFATGYCWPDNSQKMFRIGYDDVVNPSSKKEYNLVTGGGGTDVNIQMFCGLGDNTSCNVDFADHSDTAHPINSFVKWDYHLKLNTPGVADGFVKVYKNDVILISHTSVDLRGTDTRGLDYFWIGGNSSNFEGHTLACAGHRYIDTVKICQTYPCTAAGGDGSYSGVAAIRALNRRGR